MVYCLLLLLFFVICCYCFCGEMYVGTVVFSPVHNKLMRMRITRNVLLSAQMGELASVVLICIITSRYNEVK